MNGLSEAEELELLTLERERGMGQQSQPEPSFQSQVPEILKQAGQAVLDSSPAKLTEKFMQTDPATMQRVGGPALPIVGGALGSVPGAMIGEELRQFTGTAFAPETVPKTTLGRMASVAAAGVMQEPKMLEAIPGVPQAVDLVKNLASRAGAGTAKMLGALTGKGAAKVGRLADDPLAVLPEMLGGSKSVESASKAYGEALENAPIHHPEGYVTRGLEKLEFDPFSEDNVHAAEIARTVRNKWLAGEPITAQEAYNAKRATDYTWPKVVKEGNAERIRLLAEFKNGMDDVLSSQQGSFLKASKDYARARLGADFTQILPRTKTGDISTVKTLLLHTLAPGRGAGMLAGGITSPAVTGLGNLAVQGGMKGLNKLAENPAIRQVLLQVLQRLNQNKPQGVQ